MSRNRDWESGYAACVEYLKTGIPRRHAVPTGAKREWDRGWDQARREHDEKEKRTRPALDYLDEMRSLLSRHGFKESYSYRIPASVVEISRNDGEIEQWVREEKTGYIRPDRITAD